MTDLTGRTPAASYKDLLQISNSNAGIDGTVRQVEDGEGTQGPFSISTGTFRILSAKTFDLASGSKLQVSSTNLTKGAIVTGTGAGAVVMQAVGADGRMVEADSATANGIKWGYAAWHLISSQSAASASAIAFSGSLDSTFNNYVVVGNDVIPVTDNTNLLLLVQSSGAWVESSYSHHTDALRSNSSGLSPGAAISSGNNLQVAFGLGTNTGEALGFELWIYGPASANHKTAKWDCTHMHNTGNFYRWIGGGAWRGGTAAVTGLQFKMDSGAIKSGTFALYGIKKS